MASRSGRLSSTVHRPDGGTLTDASTPRVRAAKFSPSLGRKRIGYRDDGPWRSKGPDLAVGKSTISGCAADGPQGGFAEVVGLDAEFCQDCVDVAVVRPKQP